MDTIAKPFDEARSDANSLLATGASIGAIGAAGALLTGAVCPLCIILTPALVGAGLVKRVLLQRNRKSLSTGR